MNNIYIKALIQTFKGFGHFLLFVASILSAAGGILWIGSIYGPGWGIGATIFFMVMVIFYFEYKSNLSQMKYEERWKGKFDE